MNRDKLSKKAKRIAQAHAKQDVPPALIWLISPPELGINECYVCYRLAEGQSRVVVKQPLPVTFAEWERYVRFQSQFKRGGSRKVAAHDENRKKKRYLARTSESMANRHADWSIPPRDIWVLPATDLGPDHYRVCYRLGKGGARVVIDEPVVATEAMWNEYCRKQSKYMPGYRRRVEEALAKTA
ncbi:hypothetical protein ACT3SP_01055 [Brachybacterium sp. AOP43-C2-M15]|uniref:hypothetical protein n=1 Tax=Brachybacterium sp. AOP43-C2-M15 TaxID=3457661 RepID=UPI0040348AB4